MNANSNKLVCFVVVFWSTLTLVFDSWTCFPAARQALASRYASTTGTIVASHVTENEGDDGTTFGVAFRYTYLVAGKEYTGTRYRYGKLNPSDSDWASAAVATRPPGSTTTVYFDARNPAQSVLSPGLEASDLFLVAFMTPFNLAMVYLWWWGWSRLRRLWFKPVAGGVKIMSGLKKTRVRLTQYSPLGMAAVTSGSLSIMGALAVAICFGFHPSVRTMTVIWCAILGGGMAAGVWHAVQAFSGRHDLILDDLAGLMELPAGYGRKTRQRVPYAAVKDIYVEITKKRSGEDGEKTTYAPTLRLRQLATERLVEWLDPEKAEGFVEWLRDKLRVAASSSRSLAAKP